MKRYHQNQQKTKRLFCARALPADLDLPLLLLRLVGGVAFAWVGWGKIQDPLA